MTKLQHESLFFLGLTLFAAVRGAPAFVVAWLLITSCAFFVWSIIAD